MNDSKGWKEYLRSTHGQVSLFAITFAGAIVLAAVSIAVRSIFFEQFVREKYTPADDRLIKAVEEIARGGSPPDEGDEFTRAELDLIYGAWIGESIEDPQGLAADYLFAAHGRELLEKIRGTFVAGSLSQKLRAIELIQHTTDEELRAEAVELCEYLRERAERRNETTLKDRIEEVIRKLTAAN